MADSEFWRKLAKKFRKVDPDGCLLGMVWSYSLESKRHYFGFRHDPSADLIQARFDLLAVRAGREIDSINPREAWLTLLKNHGQSVNRGQIKQFEPGSDHQSAHNTGELIDICKVAETVCCRMQRQALEVEGKPAQFAQGIAQETAITINGKRDPRRVKLLAEYKAATGTPSDRRIYTAQNSNINKPEFYEWLSGSLRDSSKTTIKFEKFLRLRKSPIPKK